MKVQSLDGKQVGKLGGRVYYVNHGVNISREYNGEVSNPNTAAQVSQRSRFKLASQVSAAVEPVIVIPRKGLLSPRNLFVKKNMGFFYADGEGAAVTYENLQITPGSIGLGPLKLTQLPTGLLSFRLQYAPSAAVSRVIYCFFVKNDYQQLVYVTSKVIEPNAATPTFGNVMDMSIFPSGADIICLAYGMCDSNAKATATYESYNVQSGADIAKLVANRKLELGSFSFTQTRGTTLFNGEDTNITPGDDEVLLYLTALNGGSISAAVNGGNPIIVTNDAIPVPIGATVVLSATHSGGTMQFAGWFNNGEQRAFSYENPLTITINSMRDIVANWNVGGLE